MIARLLGRVIRRQARQPLFPPRAPAHARACDSASTAPVQPLHVGDVPFLVFETSGKI
jgi:hypothetical protein